MPLGKLFTMCLILWANVLYSQVNTNDLNRVITKHFDLEELITVESNSPDIYSSILYYFKNSFEISDTLCDECLNQGNELFNSYSFDITEFEHLRGENDPVTFIFKNSFVISLKPRNVITNEMDGMSTDQVINYIEPRPFPQWESTGNDNTDYRLYKKRVNEYAEDFPHEYRTLTSSQDLLKIKFENFKELPQNRRQTLFSHQGGYLIID